MQSQPTENGGKGQSNIPPPPVAAMKIAPRLSLARSLALPFLPPPLSSSSFVGGGGDGSVDRRTVNGGARDRSRCTKRLRRRLRRRCSLRSLLLHMRRGETAPFSHGLKIVASPFLPLHSVRPVGSDFFGRPISTVASFLLLRGRG